MLVGNPNRTRFLRFSEGSSKAGAKGFPWEGDAVGMRSLAVRAPRWEAEVVRRRLLEAGLLEGTLRVAAEGDSIVFPVRGPPVGLAVIEADFEPAVRTPRSYRDVCLVPEALRELLPTAFDQIGDIVLLKLPEPLVPHAAEVGRAILEVQARARVVCLDSGVKGAFRVREVRVVAGEARTVTEHREHGLRLKVDVGRAYYSPRLGTERLRVARLVRPGEAVVDLFAGVGPLALLVARLAPRARVHAVDANPEAFRLLEENIRLNRAGNVTAVLSDAGAFLAGEPRFDRIAMDLPRGAHAFLPAALRSVRVGGVVHYYEILELAGRERREAAIAAEGDRLGVKATVTEVRQVHAYSATQGMFAVDIRVG